MLAFLRGTIIHSGDRELIIDVGGVGYRVFCLPSAALLLGTQNGEVKVHTFQYVRDDALELYGFVSAKEAEMFKILIGISGIGPKGAMGVLSAAPLDVLQRAIASGDTLILTRVSGIGNKIAQKIVLELKDKFGEEWGSLPGNIKDETDMLDALEGLGYSRTEAQKAVRALPAEATNAEERIREALKLLGKH